MRYLTAVHYDDMELWELCECRHAMPKAVINAMEDDDYYEWAQCQLEVIRAKRKVAKMQRELDKKNNELINAEKYIKFSD
jgi:transcription initiation factor TFIID subunit TAF12